MTLLVLHLSQAGRPSHQFRCCVSSLFPERAKPFMHCTVCVLPEREGLRSRFNIARSLSFPVEKAFEAILILHRLHLARARRPSKPFQSCLLLCLPTEKAFEATSMLFIVALSGARRPSKLFQSLFCVIFPEQEGLRSLF